MRQLGPARRQRGVSLLELIFTMAIVAVAVVAAIPLSRSLFASTQGPEALAEQLVRDMTRARTLAVIHGATNPEGYEVRFLGSSDDYQDYEIIERSTSAVIPPRRTIHAGASGSTRVTCSSPTGAARFVFTPLGTVRVLDSTGSEVIGDPDLVVERGSVRYEVSVAQGTGFAEAVEVAGGGEY